jgi:hypothetical protein
MPTDSSVDIKVKGIDENGVVYLTEPLPDYLPKESVQEVEVSFAIPTED